MRRRAPAVLGALVCAALLPASARSAVPTPALTGLRQAQGALRVLTGQTRTGSARRLLAGAFIDVGRATAASLWIDARHVVAPDYGATVFADTRAALGALERVPAAALPGGRLADAEVSILAADRQIAVAAIRQAAGGSGGLLARARGMILSGDRWAQTSRIDLGAVQYGAAWRSTFAALTTLVATRAAIVPPAALGHAAENALARAATTPVGVHKLSGRGVLQRAGKPEVLFVGLESCASCAIERWGLVVALARFGTFANLHLSQSATTSRPVVRSFTFAGSRYVSPYVAFEPVELFSNVPRPGGGYEPRGRLTPAERSLLRALDPASRSPFVDVANQLSDLGAAVSPRLLGSSSWTSLAGSLQRPKTSSGQAIAASAEVLTAEICRATGGAPAAVCASAAVQDYSSRLAQFGGRGGSCPLTGPGLPLSPAAPVLEPARLTAPAGY